MSEDEAKETSESLGEAKMLGQITDLNLAIAERDERLFRSEIRIVFLIGIIYGLLMAIYIIRSLKEN